MSTQAAAQHEQAPDQYEHAARPSMDEERIQMVVDYYKATDTPHVLRLYAMSDHSAEAYEAFRRLLTERQVAIPPPSGPRQSSSRRQQPVALVRARVLLGIAALASLDWAHRGRGSRGGGGLPGGDRIDASRGPCWAR